MGPDFLFGWAAAHPFQEQCRLASIFRDLGWVA